MMQELIERQSQNIPVHNRHSFHPPVLGAFAHLAVERSRFTGGALEKPARKAFDFGIEVAAGEEGQDHVLGPVPSDFPLKEHLQRKFAGFSA
jgi:hypothetical protein